MTARKIVAAAISLIAIGAILVIVLSGGGASGSQAGRAPSIGPNVAVRVSGDPAVAGNPNLLQRLVTAANLPGTTAALAKEEHGLPPAQLKFARDLLSRASWLTMTMERSCPPPALLGCHAELRICARLGASPTRPFTERFRATVMGALRENGLRRLAFRGDTVHSKEEVLARWRIDGDVLELATGWLKLGHCQLPPPGNPPAPSVEVNPRELAQL